MYLVLGLSLSVEKHCSRPVFLNFLGRMDTHFWVYKTDLLIVFQVKWVAKLCFIGRQQHDTENYRFRRSHKSF